MLYSEDYPYVKMEDKVKSFIEDAPANDKHREMMAHDQLKTIKLIWHNPAGFQN